LRKLLPKLSDKMLTERLHDLIAAGLVVRAAA
jgi:DNA-binding HxlR family transcriptional regulator